MNKFFKNKFAQLSSVERDNAEVSVSAWEIYDEYDQLRLKEEREREEREQMVTVQSKNDEEDENEDESKDMDEAVGDDGDNSDISSIKSNGSTDRKSFVLVPQFKEHLMTMERMVVQNKYHSAQEEYKDFRIKKIEEPEEEIKTEEKLEEKEQTPVEEMDEIDKLIAGKQESKQEEDKIEKEPVC